MVVSKVIASLVPLSGISFFYTWSNCVVMPIVSRPIALQLLL